MVEGFDVCHHVSLVYFGAIRCDEITGEKKVGTKKAITVKVTRDERPAMTLFFDAETRLLTKAEFIQGNRIVINNAGLYEVFIDEYVEKAGQKLISKLHIVLDGQTELETTLSDMKFVDKLDPKLFEEP